MLLRKVCMCLKALYLFGFINREGCLPDSNNGAAKDPVLVSLLFPLIVYSFQTMYGKYSIKVDNWHSTLIEIR